MKLIVPESLMSYLKENHNTIKGGKGDKLTAQDVCPKQLAIGKIVEKEHSKNVKEAEEIALDHLAENDKYYTDLVEKGMVDEYQAITKYVYYFGKSKLPEKYKKMLQENN